MHVTAVNVPGKVQIKTKLTQLLITMKGLTMCEEDFCLFVQLSKV